jgi:hypothetical protein
MLRQGFAAGGDRRGDLLVRMHVLPRLCGQQARRALPELRRQFRATTDPAGFKAREQPAVEAAGVQAGRLRASRTVDPVERFHETDQIGWAQLWTRLMNGRGADFLKTTPCKVDPLRPTLRPRARFARAIEPFSRAPGLTRTGQAPETGDHNVTIRSFGGRGPVFRSRHGRLVDDDRRLRTHHADSLAGLARQRRLPKPLIALFFFPESQKTS